MYINKASVRLLGKATVLPHVKLPLEISKNKNKLQSHNFISDFAAGSVIVNALEHGVLFMINVKMA